jgi:hypothetical protein
MSALELEIMRRNARLRAWRGCGFPVEGEWRLYPGPQAYLVLGCAVCSYARVRAWPGGEFRAASDGGVGRMNLSAESLSENEQSALRVVLSYACPHLAPMLSPAPPEVEAAAELEVLSG